jgi:hypothetical protein
MRLKKASNSKNSGIGSENRLKGVEIVRGESQEKAHVILLL